MLIRTYEINRDSRRTVISIPNILRYGRQSSKLLKTIKTGIADDEHNKLNQIKKDDAILELLLNISQIQCYDIPNPKNR